MKLSEPRSRRAQVSGDAGIRENGESRCANRIESGHLAVTPARPRTRSHRPDPVWFDGFLIEDWRFGGASRGKLTIAMDLC